MRFSIQWLFAFVAIAAVFTAALLYRKPAWASVAVTSTMLLFVVATCRSALSSTRRSFTLPFCLTGWLYLGVVFLPVLSEAHRFLFTTRLLGHGWTSLKDGQQAPWVIKIGGVNFLEFDSQLAVEAAVQPYQSPQSEYYLELRSFFYAGDCLSAVVLAAFVAAVTSLLIRQKTEH